MNSKQSIEEAAKEYADKSFVPIPNKQGEERAHLVGHKHPFGYRKHFNPAKKHFIAGAEWQLEQFKAQEQKHITDEEINALAGNKFEELFGRKPVFIGSSEADSAWLRVYIIGFKAALELISSP